MSIKKALLVAIATFLTAPSSVNAACTGCTYVGPVDVDLDYLYHYEARVRYQYWYTNASGQYTMRWKYADISGSTQTYCEQQLASWTGSGAQVVEFCHRVRN